MSSYVEVTLYVNRSDTNIKSNREAGSVILKIAYGYNTEPHKPDPLVQLAGKAMDEFAKAGVPGAWLVDLIPSCTIPFLCGLI